MGGPAARAPGDGAAAADASLPRRHTGRHPPLRQAAAGRPVRDRAVEEDFVPRDRNRRPPRAAAAALGEGDGLRGSRGPAGDRARGRGGGRSDRPQPWLAQPATAVILPKRPSASSFRPAEKNSSSAEPPLPPLPKRRPHRPSFWIGALVSLFSWPRKLPSAL